jgi:hypothetical protein
MRGIIGIIQSLDSGEGADITEVMLAVERAGIDCQLAEVTIDKLKERGSIFEPGYGKLKVI